MKTIFKTTLVLVLTLVIFSCSKDDNSIVSVATLNSISPESGPKGTIVTINGSNFGNDIGTIKVFFNDVEAVVQSVNDAEIKVNVPTRAYTGLVKIISNGTELLGPEFTYIISDVQVSTLAGSTLGFADGLGNEAQFSFPYGIASDALGNIYIADFFNDKIRKITENGMVSTLAGSTQGYADGTGSIAQFNRPIGVVSDVEGSLFVADRSNHKIRKIAPNGKVTTLAGSILGFADGLGSNAQFYGPFSVAVDSQGMVYVADLANHKIRKITPEGLVSTLAGSTQGFEDGVGTSAKFDKPSGLVIDSHGNILVVDKFNDKIRKITPDGVVSTFAGSTRGYADGIASNAQFSLPFGIAIDSYDNVYIADTSNGKIRKITPEGIVSTIAGSTRGYADGAGSEAQFNLPTGVAVFSQGIVYVADKENHKIRKITLE